VPLSGDEGAVRVTIAKWLTPKGRTIHETGLIPDVYIPMTEEDYAAERDPQLDVAVETLMAMIQGSPIPTSVPTATPSLVPSTSTPAILPTITP
jgi:carboxyl-terminal processing protease